MNVEVGKQARVDLYEIWAYITRDNPDAALRILVDFEATIAQLAEFPRLGRPREDLKQGLRALVFGKYLIFYEIYEHRNVVHVLRVIAGKRKVEDQIRGE